MKKSIICFSLFVITILFLLTSCSKETSTQPKFIYMKGPSTDAIAKIGNKIITEKDLFQGIEGDIFDAQMKLYDIKMNRLKAMILKELIDNHPKKAKLTNDQFLDKHIAKNISISQKDIDSFAKERRISKEQINEQMKERIIKYLEVQKKKIAVDQWMAKQTKKNPVEVYLAKPKRFTFNVDIKDAPFTGKSDAKITIIEYTDFQCPFCAKGHDVIKKIKKQYGKKIKHVVKHFPLPFHHNAPLASEASFCAYEQDRKYFQKLNDLMFENQSQLDLSGLKELAKNAGLKIDQFSKCLESHKYAKKITSDITQGQQLGIKSVPVFFVNGKLVNGAHPINVFQDIINEELKENI